MSDFGATEFKPWKWKCIPRKGCGYCWCYLQKAITSSTTARVVHDTSVRDPSAMQIAVPNKLLHPSLAPQRCRGWGSEWASSFSYNYKCHNVKRSWTWKIFWEGCCCGKCSEGSGAWLWEIQGSSHHGQLWGWAFLFNQIWESFWLKKILQVLWSSWWWTSLDICV